MRHFFDASDDQILMYALSIELLILISWEVQEMENLPGKGPACDTDGVENGSWKFYIAKYIRGMSEKKPYYSRRNYWRVYL